MEDAGYMLDCDLFDYESRKSIPTLEESVVRASLEPGIDAQPGSWKVPEKGCRRAPAQFACRRDGRSCVALLQLVSRRPEHSSCQAQLSKPEDPLRNHGRENMESLRSTHWKARGIPSR